MVTLFGSRRSPSKPFPAVRDYVKIGALTSSRTQGCLKSHDLGRSLLSEGISAVATRLARRSRQVRVRLSSEASQSQGNHTPCLVHIANIRAVLKGPKSAIDWRFGVDIFCQRLTFRSTNVSVLVGAEMMVYAFAEATAKPQFDQERSH